MTSGLAIIASPRGLVETRNPGLSLRPSESQFAYEPELKVFHRQIQVQAAEKQLCPHRVRSAEEKPPSRKYSVSSSVWRHGPRCLY